MRNIIIIPEEKRLSFIDVYTIKNIKNGIKLLTTDNLKEAKEICRKNPNTSVFNSRGEIIYGDTNKKKQKIIPNHKYKGREIIEEIKVIELKNENLYKTDDGKVPDRCISGIYKISKTYNGTTDRLPITTLEYQDIVIGYIKKK